MQRTRRQRFLRFLAKITVGYLLICAMLVSCQSSFVYMPLNGPTDPQQAGLIGFKVATFTADDGARIPLWEHTTSSGPIVLYFHGNGGGLYAHTGAIKFLAENGLAVSAMEYRGYPGAPGKPSEPTLVSDAVAFYDDVMQRAPDRPIVIWGYSLGTGIATQLAARRPATALVLEAPFSAAVDVAKMRFPFIPVEWLMRDKFLSRAVIAKVNTPLLIMHGEADTIVPFVLGEQLYDRANEPKEFHRYPNAGHLDLAETPAYGHALDFIQKHNRSNAD